MYGMGPSEVEHDDAESARLRMLACYELLDTPPEPHFDALARLAARLCGTSMAVISLIDCDRQWFKAEVGLNLRETPRDVSFCSRTIEADTFFEVPDARADRRFADSPLVTGPPDVRFYAGVPLRVEGGHQLGALAVLDREPRRLSAQQREDLATLAGQVVMLLEGRRQRRAAEAASAQTARQSDSLLTMLMIAGRVARLGAWEFDLGRQKVVWSDVVADIHGMPAGFSPGLQEALSFYVEPDRSRMARAVMDCQQAGTPFDCELVLQPAAGGALRWVRSIGEAVRDSDGRITHLRGACQDITERKSNLLEIQRLADRLSATLESIPDPFVAVGVDWRVQLANGAFERLVQHPGEEILGQALPDLLSASVADCGFLDHCREAIASQEPVEFEAVERLAGNRFEVRLFPVEDGLTIHARDITQREAMLAQVRLLDTCVRRLNDAVMITDANLEASGPTIVFANQAVERLCGWKPWELMGGSLQRLQGLLTQRDRLDALRDAMNAGRPFETELINYRRTGEPYWVDLKLSPIHDDTGRCTHFVAVQRDITERKQAEEHREVLETQLRQAQKMESIGTLAGGIAHDFNNILGAILGNVTLARDALSPDSAARAPLATITSSALRARSLVHQILAFGRQQATQRLPQSVQPLIDEAARLLHSTLPANVTLETRRAPEELFAEVDGNQLQQVLINLCTNAWHAMPASGGRIVIGLDTETLGPLRTVAGAPLPPGTYAHLWVQDDGCGIAAAAQARIFEPFFTTKSVDRGTGLGLSVAHGIVAAHGGTIAVESAPGKGSVFHIHLPLCVPPRREGDAPPGPAPVRLDGLRVLCVDDDPVMLVTMQALLERAGCQVDAHLDAQQALDRLRHAPGAADLLVTDFNMPGMDGMALVHAVKRLCPDLPIVMASGFVSDALREQAAQLGVRAMVQKERTVEDLVNAVRDVVAGTADQGSAYRAWR